MSDKPLHEMTDEELAAERDRWDQKIQNATGWGASLAAADSFRRNCEREIKRRKRTQPVPGVYSPEQVTRPSVDTQFAYRNTDPDCPPSIRGDMLPISAQVHAADALDAARYRWLRAQHWYDSDIAVVRNPKKSINLGSECPSGQLLDEVIDAALSIQDHEDKPKMPGTVTL